MHLRTIDWNFVHFYMYAILDGLIKRFFLHFFSFVFVKYQTQCHRDNIKFNNFCKYSCRFKKKVACNVMKCNCDLILQYYDVLNSIHKIYYFYTTN